MRGQRGFVLFRDETRIEYDPPRSTTDPRWKACEKHHVACDCREAEYQEEIAEYQGEHASLKDALATVLRGHISGCGCTGCQIARRLFMSYLIEPELVAATVAATTKTAALPRAPRYWPPLAGDLWRDPHGHGWACQVEGGYLVRLDGRADDAPDTILEHYGPLQLVFRAPASLRPVSDEEVPF